MFFDYNKYFNNDMDLTGCFPVITALCKLEGDELCPVYRDYGSGSNRYVEDISQYGERYRHTHHFLMDAINKRPDATHLVFASMNPIEGTFKEFSVTDDIHSLTEDEIQKLINESSGVNYNDSYFNKGLFVNQIGSKIKDYTFKTTISESENTDAANAIFSSKKVSLFNTFSMFKEIIDSPNYNEQITIKDGIELINTDDFMMANNILKKIRKDLCVELSPMFLLNLLNSLRVHGILEMYLRNKKTGKVSKFFSVDISKEEKDFTLEIAFSDRFKKIFK